MLFFISHKQQYRMAGRCWCKLRYTRILIMLLNFVVHQQAATAAFFNRKARNVRVSRRLPHAIFRATQNLASTLRVQSLHFLVLKPFPFFWNFLNHHDFTLVKTSQSCPPGCCLMKSLRSYKSSWILHSPSAPSSPFLSSSQVYTFVKNSLVLGGLIPKDETVRVAGTSSECGGILVIAHWTPIKMCVSLILTPQGVVVVLFENLDVDVNTHRFIVVLDR